MKPQECTPEAGGPRVVWEGPECVDTLTSILLGGGKSATKFFGTLGRST